MKRARAGGHKGAIKQVIDAHIDVEVIIIKVPFFKKFIVVILFLPTQIESASDLTEEVIIQKLRAAGGAHQPTSYEFSNYSS